MTAIFEWALMNSAMALLLAVPAYASSWLKRPAITHAMWLLVLLRLVAPPMWIVPVAWQSDVVAEVPTAAVVMAPIVEPEPIDVRLRRARDPDERGLGDRDPSRMVRADPRPAADLQRRLRADQAEEVPVFEGLYPRRARTRLAVVLDHGSGSFLEGIIVPDVVIAPLRPVGP